MLKMISTVLLLSTLITSCNERMYADKNDVSDLEEEVETLNDIKANSLCHVSNITVETPAAYGDNFEFDRTLEFSDYKKQVYTLPSYDLDRDYYYSISTQDFDDRTFCRLNGGTVYSSSWDREEKLECQINTKAFIQTSCIISVIDKKYGPNIDEDLLLKLISSGGFDDGGFLSHTKPLSPKKVDPTITFKETYTISGNTSYKYSIQCHLPCSSLQ